ncbi:hypothetical protein, partial [uncultured Aquimarina sp.]|uniref:leucine-rich repeat domain-containing protein n=1 Tax=uncultured Aquimarina sp. TaxID=575652 RepID=UPI0026257BF0
PGATNKDLVIANATAVDAGVYHFTATNNIVTGLTLERNPINLTVEGDTCGVSDAQKQALIDLYNSTDGANWTDNTNWLTDAPVCDWYGVAVVNGKVVSISLSLNNLKGTLPTSLNSLTSLSSLYLQNNLLEGNIPQEIGELSSLRFLILHSNNFSGSIPPQLGNLTSLLDLILYSNNLTGPIPSELGQLSSLRDLNLFRNNLSGTIPSELGNLSGTLFRINVSQNQYLSGKIPSSLLNLSGLQILRYNNNSFVFSDIEDDFDSFSSKLQTYAYAPQAKVDETETVSVTENGSITLSSTALTSANN